MQCPKCQFEDENETAECRKCGVVFEKYIRQQQEVVLVPAAKPNTAVSGESAGEETQREFRYRLFALPLALVIARVCVGWVPLLVRLLTMWVHELGHAATAWLSGFWAMPGPWFTPVDEGRSVAVILVVLAAVAFATFRSWHSHRLALVVATGALLIFQLVCTLSPSHRAHAFIIFGGDAGSMVIGCILMATFYVRRESVIYGNSLRWGFLPIGAAAFIDPLKTWTGRVADIPFGTQNGFPTDPSQLVDTFGWSVPFMIDRYVRLGEACLLALTLVYVIGIIRARKNS